jgi:2'-5' RNA ligase
MAGDETALIVEVPAAEVVVGRHRAGLDRAAALGVPAHVTVLYPFRPVALLAPEDHDRLDDVFGGAPAFTLVLSRCAWFGEAVLYLAPEDPAPLRALTGSVARAFPEHPPYDGALEEVVPHLTVGHDHPREVLEAAEREVVRGLPVTQHVGEVSLWRGPPLLRTATSRWRRVRRWALAAPSPGPLASGTGVEASIVSGVRTDDRNA